MIHLLKKLRRREAVMAAACIILILCQVYFDLKLPDYMSSLTVTINTPGSSVGDVWSTGVSMLLCTLASAVVSVACGYFVSRVAAGFSYTVREELFTHVLGFGQQEMQGFSVPSLINRTTNDITQIQMFVSMGLMTLVRAPITAAWAIAKILGKSWQLSALTAVFVVLMDTAGLLVIRSVLPRFRLVQKLTDQINRVARENLTGINVVHAFNAEDYQNGKFELTNDRMMRTQMKNQKLFAILQPAMGLGMNALSLCIFWLGAALINGISAGDMAGRMTMFGDIVVFSTYATYVVMSFMMLIMIFMMFPAAQVSAARIREVLDTDYSVTEGKVREGRETGTVEFRNVSFRYPGSAADQLSNISFRAEKGETVAFIGATGSGKTTLVDLAARMYDASSGQVLIDGMDVRDYSFRGLYEKLGYVTQKAVLFSGTIGENLTFGQAATATTEADVERAIDISQSREFVSGFDDGTEHRISQSGRNVSGGQKQRLSIARALARKPEILIFDDSFSALDYATDARLRRALSEQLEGVTCLIVAQRISTIRNADKIVVLDRGEAVGIGSHSQLMSSCPVYREIALSQLSEEELGKEE